MSEAPHLLTEEDRAILIATLNRPDKLNALTGATMSLFEAALHRFRDTPALKVRLVRAAGRYFCSGADMRGGDRAPVQDVSRRAYSLPRNIRDDPLRVAIGLAQRSRHVREQRVCVGRGIRLNRVRPLF